MSADKCDLNRLHSTREEMRAILNAEVIVNICNECFGKVEQQIEFVCDNKSALRKLNNKADGFKKTPTIRFRGRVNLRN